MQWSNVGMSERINSGQLGTNLVCKISKENIGNNHTNIIIILFAFQSVQIIYLRDKESQEAIRLMGEATSLLTLPVYLKKIKCCKCAAWLAQNFKAKRRKRPHMHHHHHHHFIYLSISTKNLSMWKGDPGSHQAYGTGHLTFNTTGIFKKD